MKKNIILGFVMVMAFSFFGCDPELGDSPSIGNPPTEEQLGFVVEQDATDPFRYHFKNESSVTGIASWVLGGTRRTGDNVSIRFPMPGEHEISLTVSTRGGSASKTTTLTTEDTDWDFLASPEMVLLSGGIEAESGKSWVLDSLTWGHLGVGPAGSNGLDWWGAGPLDKADVLVLYEDVMNFNIVGLEFNLHNNGASYVKDYRASDPAFSNPEERDTDYKVDFTPSPAEWTLEQEGGEWYLVFVPSEGPIFPIFDVGAVDNRYRVITLEENKLELVALGSDGNAWHYKFIPQGYVRPVATFEIGLEAGTNPNEYHVGLSDLIIPEGANFQRFTVNFGDGTVESSNDPEAVITHSYMRRATYNVVVTLVTSIGEFTHSTSINVEDHHPDYEEFIINDFVLYNNFSDVAMVPFGGEDIAITIVDNPLRQYPNRTSKVAHYRKENSEWGNAYMQLPSGYRFDIREISTFRMMVYGKAGQAVLLKLENTDLGGDAWTTGTELIYTIQNDNTWEIATFDFEGVPASFDWHGGYAPDVTADNRYNHNYYNIIRIMCNPGVGDGVHEFYFDELYGPHVEGIKSTR
ncbi:PKD domain-containing protein [Alkalitalea saponilacus]|uniref:PKD domain-containing protein n=1 Tax=Alkalitalea saponilacus TaxID=889453 RepID=A0A1T5D9H2_9BACT|nr:PKD domain-containing protein [Alkalitalea saponilacus]ASB50626.1 hypothetical protein CDL62_16470 [Alkalitalea saponilacus]SKB68140.1 hypothetical protein SAMN03080601_01032 [Alkalitalea saponilacus]